MIYQLLISFFLVFYFYSFGLLFNKIIPQLNQFYSLTILNGMIGVGLIGFVGAFIFPLNYFFEIILIASSLLGLFIYKEKVYNFFKFFKTLPYFIYVILLSGLIFTITYPYILDHFGYYIPTIKWLDYAGYVKGLSNLEWVLVQNSFWHVLQASINEIIDTFYRLNFILFIVFNLYVIESKSLKLLGFNLFFVIFLNTPSPDLPVLVLSVILINEYLAKPVQVSKYLFFATILFLIKPISILLIIFFSFELIRKKEYKNWKDIHLLLVIVLGFLFCLKGIIISANPFFPLSFTSIDSLSWASPNSLYIDSQFSGKFIPLKEIFTFEEVQQMSKVEYLKNVLLSNALRSRILLFIVIITFILLIISISRYKKDKLTFLLMASAVVKVAFILITSPQYRFLLDVLLIDLIVLSNCFRNEYFNTKWIGLNVVLILSLSFLVLFPSIWNSKLTRDSTLSFVRNLEFKSLIKPNQYDDIKFESKKLVNLNFNYPTDYPLIYSANVPAVSFITIHKYYNKNGFPQLFEVNNPKKGFYWRALTDKEKKEIEDFLKKETKKQVK